MFASRIAYCWAVLLAVSACSDGENARPDSNSSVDGGPPQNQGQLQQEPLWSIPGPIPGAECQIPTATVGDINGDGLQDLALLTGTCTFADLVPGHILVYPGEGSYFKAEPIRVVLTYTRESTPDAPIFAFALKLDDIDGDAFADLVVASSEELQVFAGGSDIAAALANPTSRISIGQSFLPKFEMRDVTGDQRSDIILESASEVLVIPATPNAAQPFGSPRVFGDSTLALLADLDHDSALDLGVLSFPDSSGAPGQLSLFYGCRNADQTCETGLRATPAWTGPFAGSVLTTLPDRNDDGLDELVVAPIAGGILQLAVSQKPGFSNQRSQTVVGDHAFPNLGVPGLSVSDWDGDIQSSEFIATASGKMYLMSAPSSPDEPIKALYAWPDTETLSGSSPFNGAIYPLRIPDRNDDGIDDLLVVVGSDWYNLSLRPGQIMVLPGGKAPSDGATPLLPTVLECPEEREGGMPDLTVDTEVLQRTMYIEHIDFPANACEVQEQCVGGPGERKLLRFSVSIPNLGDAPAILPSPSDRPDLYQFDMCHGHDHVLGFASYELIDQQDSVVTSGHKQGYFLVNFEPYCGNPRPAVFSVDGSQRIDVGWSDIYVASIPCQWIDVTDVPDGDYKLRVTIDAKDAIAEADILPNVGEIELQLSGDSVK